MVLVVLTLPLFTVSPFHYSSIFLFHHLYRYFPLLFFTYPFHQSLSQNSRIHHSKSNPKVMSFKGKAKNELVLEEDGYEDEEEAIEVVGCGEDDKKKKPMIRRGSNGSGGGGVAPPCCQAEKCTFDLSDAKRYHRRHKVCEQHSKAPIVIVAGLRQRFCQQCSRFHELSEFDEAKRSCRRRLAGHNERRRKSSAESNGEGSSDKGAEPLKESHCRPANQNGRIPMPISGHAKHFQIR